MDAPSLCVLLPGEDPGAWPAAAFEIRRYGFDRVLLVDAPQDLITSAPGSDLETRHVGESGTIDALQDALSQFDDTVLLVKSAPNVGRFNWLDLVPRLASRPSAAVALACGPAGPDRPMAALIKRDALRSMESIGSLAGLARRFDAVEASYDDWPSSAGTSATAVFFDRDGVINADHGYVGDVSRFEFLSGAIAGVKAANDRGALTFLVTNQSGVARGYFSERDVATLHRHMTDAMRREGAHFDEIRICPHLPDGTVAAYRMACRCRKPEPGMILDLLDRWPIDAARSVLVGDKNSDMQAAAAAGVGGLLYTGGRLADLVVASLARTVGPVPT